MKKQNKHYEDLRKEFMPDSLIDTTLSRLKTIVKEISNKQEGSHNREYSSGKEEMSIEEQLLNKIGLIDSRGDGWWETLHSYVSWYVLKPTQKGIEFYNKLKQEVRR